MTLALLTFIQMAFSGEMKHLGVDGDRFSAPFSVAAVGNLCTGSLFSSNYCAVSTAILKEIGQSDVQGAVLLGDFIKSPKPKIWAQQLTYLISVLGDKSILALPGHSEYAQKDLLQFGESFGSTKQDIGINRYSGWQHLRIQDGSAQWTLLFLDVFQDKMGTKWREQQNWLEGILDGNKDQIVLFLDQSPKEIPNGTHKAAQELIDFVYSQTGLSQVRLVVFSGRHSTQAFLPDTNFDALYLGCGGGGAMAQDVSFENKDGLRLHPMLQSYYISSLETLGIDEKTKSKALGEGDFAGKPAVLDGKGFPTYGWCRISLQNGLHVSIDHTLDGTSFSSALRLSYTAMKGWTVTPKEEESPVEPQ